MTSRPVGTVMVSVRGGGLMPCTILKHPKPYYPFEPTHELEAPSGYRFCDDTVHSYPCCGMDTVRERAADERLEVCPDDCDCKGDGPAACGGVL